MIRVALNHKTEYSYDSLVELCPQVVRLRPAPHCRTPIRSYSLQISPEEHFLNWQQDPHSNYLARLVFPDKTRRFAVEVDLVAEMTVINPFDFFLEPSATKYPFRYDETLAKDLTTFLDAAAPSSELSRLLDAIGSPRAKTIDFLVELNQQIQKRVEYVIRLEPGVQSPGQTLALGCGSCRDSAWLLVEVLRHLGLAARFVSGYLIQLKPDVESLDGPSGTSVDFTDLHAWTEVFLPGAGWIGLDPTSGLLAGEGHIPLACTPEPLTAAPVSGMVGECQVEFKHEMSVVRIHEDPRVTKPYTEEQWEKINATGHQIDGRLEQGGVRLTMGGEPTFVSIDDSEADEWNTSAVGPHKRRLAENLIQRLRRRFAPGGLMHYGQGKWYPGESLPRWTLTCLWRTDGLPIWENTALLADPSQPGTKTHDDAQRFTAALAERLGVAVSHVTAAYEDALYYLWKERRLPLNADVHDADLEDPEARAQLARVFGRGLAAPVGCLLPLEHQWWNAQPRWTSGEWPVRSEQMFLLPGDSPMGLRLPLDALPAPEPWAAVNSPGVPFAAADPLPDLRMLRNRLRSRTPPPASPQLSGASSGPTIGNEQATDRQGTPDTGVVHKAICVEPRNGTLHVFMPPLDRLEGYFELLAAIETTAEELDLPVILEGYLPPPDHRLRLIKVAPDPGVIEVNVHPAHNWQELVEITSGIYEDARETRLASEKFDLDGTHTGTGGGNHIVMGAPTPQESPFLRRPDLLRSFVGYWHNHPSLSYLFSGKFVGPTSQAPRVDEGRRDATYELQIAFEQIPEQGDCPPWIVDRIFRHLLVDLTGNTHRAEFCIDKLYSPDSPTGRLGLVEFRAFEMPPHWQMSLTQQLLLRALVARFWEQPYVASLVDWNTAIHDRWMLPHFVRLDMAEVLRECAAAGFALDAEWFAPHFEFRFPVIGTIEQHGIQLELRTAIEPWYVLGEEPAGGATARYVDSSVERLQVRATGMSGDRIAITCNGRRVPLHRTGTEGESVAGVRYRAWQPASCLHPTIPVDEPLVFDILDTWSGHSLGGCRYHVGHPGGLNPSTIPVNAYESESRRATRFFQFGHTGGQLHMPKNEDNPAFPMTLDLRRNRVAK